MGTWKAALDANDSFLDIYKSFFLCYNAGQKPSDISKQLLQDFKEAFLDSDDANNSLFGLALAQWETQALDPKIFKKVKYIIEKESDLSLWKSKGVDEKNLKKRKVALKKFLAKISVKRDNAKPRVKAKLECTEHELLSIVSPNGKLKFRLVENFVSGMYKETCGIVISSFSNYIFHFYEQEKNISVKWAGDNKIVLIYNKQMSFNKNSDFSMNTGFKWVDGKGKSLITLPDK